jgi:hypothetical protein
MKMGGDNITCSLHAHVRVSDLQGLTAARNLLEACEREGEARGCAEKRWGYWWPTIGKT